MEKNVDLRVNISATTSQFSLTNIRFSTQDEGSAMLTFYLFKDGVELPLNAVTGKIVLRMSDGSKFIDTVNITDRVNGIVEYLLTSEQLKHYGKVTAELYLNYEEQKMSVHRFAFIIEQALIDTDIPVITEFYVDNFEELKSTINSMADETKEIITTVEESVEEAKDLAETTISLIQQNQVAKQSELQATNAQLATLDQKKADQSFVDYQFASIVSGAPKGTYTTLSALQSAYPSGTSGVFLVSSTGHWHYWNGVTNTWEDGGLYQSSGLADESVSERITTFFNKVEGDYPNLYSTDGIVTGYAISTSTGNPTVNADYCYKRINCKANETYKANKTTGGQHVTFFKTDGTYLGYHIFSSGLEFTTPINTAYMLVTAQPATSTSLTIKEKYAYYFSNDKIKDLPGSKVLTKSLTSDKMSFISEVVASNNLFNKNKVKNGYYLAVSSGAERENADFTYGLEYIPVTASTTYSCPSGNRLICFYDANFTFLSGMTATNGLITTPSGCAYMRISFALSDLDTFRISKGSTLLPYDDYTIKYKFDRDIHLESSSNSPGDSSNDEIVIIAKNGSGKYTSITQAVASEPSGTVFRLMPGVYDNEVIKAWGKTVYLTGTSRKDCIIKNSMGGYHDPPLEASSGLFKNLTIISEYKAGVTTGIDSYAIHIEDNDLANKNLVFENCYIESQNNWAIGMGMRGGCYVEFKGCDLVGKDGLYDLGGHGGLFFHDSAIDEYLGVQVLRVIDTNILAYGNTTTELKIQSQSKTGSTVYVEFIRTVVMNPDKGTQTKVFLNDLNGSYTNVSTIAALTNFVHKKTSFGNNMAALNYSAS